MAKAVVLVLILSFKWTCSLDPITFTEEDMSEVLLHHNGFRAKNVTPPAGDMRKITWDNELALFASNHTRYCQYKFSEQPYTKKWKQIGQSFFLAKSEWKKNFHYSAVMTWFKQGSEYNYNDESCVNFCGHYLNLMYSKTYKIGCGATSCTEVIGDTQVLDDRVMYMCVYAPMYQEGEKPYIQGEPCSHCHSNDTCEMTSLCANSGRDKQEKFEHIDPTRAAWLEWVQQNGEIWFGVALAAFGALAGLLGWIVKKCKGKPEIRPSPPEAPAELDNHEHGRKNGRRQHHHRHHRRH